MERFYVYVKAYLAASEKFDGNVVADLIDAFGETLREHLSDEIDTLLDLHKYGNDKMQKLYKELKEEGKKITVRRYVQYISWNIQLAETLIIYIATLDSQQVDTWKFQLPYQT